MIGAQSVKNLKKLYTFLAILIGLSCWTAVVNAQTVRMPDVSLAAVVRAALGLAPNAPITRQTLKKLTSLAADGWDVEEVAQGGPPIRDLTGLEHATQLTELSLDSNEIRDLGPLVGLTQLEELNIAWNLISDFRPLARLTQLQRLSLTVGRIGDIRSLNSLPLERLYILGEGSPISQLNLLTEFKQLKSLGISRAQISDLRFARGLTQLDVLNLPFNEISDLSPLADLTQLKGLGFVDNKIRDISPLAGLTRLEVLYLEGNPISDTSPLASLPNLINTDVDIPPPPSVIPDKTLAAVVRDALGLARNAPITKQTLKGLTSLRADSWQIEQVIGQRNPIRDITGLEHATKLTELLLSDNEIRRLEVPSQV